MALIHSSHCIPAQPGKVRCHRQVSLCKEQKLIQACARKAWFLKPQRDLTEYRLWAPRGQTTVRQGPFAAVCSLSLQLLLLTLSHSLPPPHCPQDRPQERDPSWHSCVRLVHPNVCDQKVQQPRTQTPGIPDVSTAV